MIVALSLAEAYAGLMKKLGILLDPDAETLWRYIGDITHSIVISLTH
jgi:hypothetical protein